MKKTLMYFLGIAMALIVPLKGISFNQDLVDTAIINKDFKSLEKSLKNEDLLKIKDYLINKLNRYFRKNELDNEYFYDYQGKGIRWKPRALKILVKKMKERGEIQEDIKIITSLDTLKKVLEQYKFEPRPLKKYLAVLTKWDHYVPIYVHSDESDSGKLKVVITESSSHDWVFENDWGINNPNIEIYFSNACRLYDQHNCSMLTISDLTEIQRHGEIGKKILNNSYSEDQILGYKIKKIPLAKLPADLMKLSLNFETAAKFLAVAEGLTDKEKERLNKALKSNVSPVLLGDQVKFRNNEIQFKALRNIIMVAIEILGSIPGLIKAVKESNIVRVKELMRENNLVPNIIDERGFSLLEIASRNQNRELIDYLVERGASPIGIKNFLKGNPRRQKKVSETLRWEVVNAVGENKLEEVKSYLDLGIDVNIKNFNGRTLIEIAAYFGHKDLFNYLLKMGGDLKSLSKFIEEDAVARNNLSKMFNKEMSQGKYLNIKTFLANSGKNDNQTLRWGIVGSVDRNNEAEVINFIKQGADINSKNSKGSTLLEMAVYNRNPSLVKLLLDYGADLTALSTTCNKFEKDGAKLENKIEEKSQLYRWEIVGSIDENNEKMLLTLLDKGANINSKNRKGRTLLEMAVFNKNPKLVKILLSKGAAIGPLAQNCFPP